MGRSAIKSLQARSQLQKSSVGDGGRVRVGKEIRCWEAGRW